MACGLIGLVRTRDPFELRGLDDAIRHAASVDVTRR
jgi:hypothetical protein